MKYRKKLGKKWFRISNNKSIKNLKKITSLNRISKKPRNNILNWNKTSNMQKIWSFDMKSLILKAKKSNKLSLKIRIKVNRIWYLNKKRQFQKSIWNKNQTNNFCWKLKSCRNKRHYLNKKYNNFKSSFNINRALKLGLLDNDIRMKIRQW